MRIWFLIFFLSCVALGCSDDTAAVGNTSDAGNPDFARTLPDTPEPPCSGCFADGECQRGDEDQRCGANGAECTVCSNGESCTEDGACAPVTGCNAETCDGCCASDGTCLPGNQAEACGVMGQACEACTQGSACNAGRCSSGCGPDNCAGCCDSTGACVGGDADAACGRAGVACEDCAIAGTTCGGGACVATSCADTCAGCCDGETCVENTDASQCGSAGSACMACQGEQTCTGGACMAVAGSSWDVEVISADLGFFPWDDWSPGDAYVDVYLTDPTGPVTRWSTPVASDTSSPVWNDFVVRGVPTDVFAEGVYIELIDRDVFDDDLICEWSTTPDASMFSAPVIEMACDFDPDIKLRWRLVPAQ